MNQIERRHVDEVLDLLAADQPARIVAVLGPRQTGKTKIVRQVLRRARRQAGIPGWLVPADDPDADELGAGPRAGRRRDAQWLASVWRAAREEARMSERGFILALDEVQHVEGWSRVAKGMWDRDRAEGRALRVVVLGPGPWDLLTGIGESLVGRFTPVQVQQWSLREMAAFDYALDEYLYYGGYPGIAADRKDWAAWRRYVLGIIVEPTISRDILSLTRVDKPALMRRFMALLPRYSGQVISFNKMLGQLQDAGNTTTLARYLDLLGNAGLAAGLPNYSAGPHAVRASSPKLNVLDPAIMTAALGYTPEEAKADGPLWDRIVVSAVGAHLHNTLPPAAKLHYWREGRSDGSPEINFVLTRRPWVLGIEVKSGRQPGPLRGLEAFQKRFPQARTMLVGDDRTPLDEFLWEPASYWLEATWK